MGQLELSYTMLQSFMRCEYSYYLRYIERVPTLETSASVYGTAIHRTIKVGYDNNLTKEELVKVFKREWFALTSAKHIIFTYEGDFLNKLSDGQKLIADYYDKFIDNVPSPKATELRFGKKEGIKLGNHLLVGIIDQIDSKNRLIDYKTGAKPTKLGLDLDLQFTLYSYAYRFLFNEPEEALVLRHLGSMKDFITTRSDKDFDTVEGEIAKIEKKINSNLFVRNLGRDCATCYFLEHCLGKERKFERWVRKR